MKASRQSNRWKQTRALLSVCSLIFLPVMAHASEQDRARALSSSGAIVPLEQITAQVRARHIGTILEVELESDDDEHYYEVEVVDNAGIVRKLRYDAVTGELLSDRPND